MLSTDVTEGSARGSGIDGADGRDIGVTTGINACGIGPADVGGIGCSSIDARTDAGGIGDDGAIGAGSDTCSPDIGSTDPMSLSTDV